MVVGVHRKTKIKIDLKAIGKNVANIKKELPPEQNLFAVVKANAYGHGLEQVAYAAREAGANGFCVAVIDEGIALRRAGIAETILILGVNPPSEAVYLAENDLSIAVESMEFLEKSQAYLSQAKQTLKVHIALDTGMGRIGFRNPADLQKALDFLKEHQEQFDFEGIFTHFATADSADDTYFKQQLAKFNELMTVVKERPRYVHVANTAASLWHQTCGGNTIRYGVGMYGLNPSGNELATPEPLYPALSLVSEVSAVKKIKAGDKIGYGITYTAKNDEWIATIPIGYADGWLRRMQGFEVLVQGHRCEIVGRVCMDQMMIRVPHKIPLGTLVTLIGEDHGEVITVQDVADYAQTIHYEIICDLSLRIDRVYC
ncbi:alanine racemase [Ligilactobacillus ceti]|uniref:Alanine racemase n=1 Tax=Ligilactobacillus ceti DSM 22408 TaxID=1122146 RepID=A0A0R2KSF7_9LACO|nr:alanine racemase [Ligilactobacillus ceti]KRN90581.1 alanine racemase [Ligilactobacillus ceti DSM 22408]